MKKIQLVPPCEEMDHSQVLKILSDPKKMEGIARFSNEHYHWDELKYRVDDKELESTWVLMKLIRRNNLKYLRLCDMEFTYSLLPGFQEALHIIDRNSAGLIELEKPSKKDVQRYVISSLMEEAIASSQMEGAVTTRKEAKQMLRSQRKPKDASEKMILNNYLAMDFLKTKIDEKMSIALISEMHKIITNDTLTEGPEWEGKFREDNETVVADPGEDVTFYTPPKCDKIPGMMQELCDFINKKDKEFIHPVVKGIIIHFMVGYIHPFVNGNGRLARSLFYWYVIKNDYWLMEYTSISRIMKNSQTKYGLAYQYTETDANDLTYFIKFNLTCIVKAVEDLRKYIFRKMREQKEIFNMIESDPDLNICESMILKDYNKNQSMFTIKEIATKYSITYQTARNYVNHLSGLNYVKAIGKKRKTMFYVCVDAAKVQRRNHTSM